MDGRKTELPRGPAGTGYRADEAVRLLIVYYGGDDPKKNTAAKLIRHGLAVRARRPPAGSLVLDPGAVAPVSRSDAAVADTRGLVVVDASWRRLRMPRGRYNARRLPLLLAANPVNYGRPFLLSSAEAAAAALYILGWRAEAERILGLFKWGPAFLEVNRRFLEAYAAAPDTQGVVEAECRFLEEIGAAPGECNEKSLVVLYRRVTRDYIARGR